MKPGKEAKLSTGSSRVYRLSVFSGRGKGLRGSVLCDLRIIKLTVKRKILSVVT